MKRQGALLFVLVVTIGIVCGGCVGVAGTTNDSAPAAPSIMTQPASQTVTAGQTATFAVVVTGTAPLNYQWQKNGNPISGVNSSSYTTPPTTSNDNGAKFQLMVSNSIGSVTSSAATLTVNTAPTGPSIVTQPSNQSVTVGQSATFTVLATGTAPLSYQWQRNGSPVTGATQASYTTPPTTSNDTGARFVVMVSNSVGSVTSNAATLTVNPAPVAPSITTQPVSQTVTVGQTATFTVVASGTAPLTYQWQKNGSPITAATQASYTTPATTSNDTGAQFVVMVSNSVGSVTSNAATLTVNPAPAVPSITTQPVSQIVTVGQTATFTVVASGTAPLTYQWQKNGSFIPAATQASYTTPATTSNDTGAQFVVMVSNPLGSVTSNAVTLTVNAAAVAPSISTQPVSQTVTVGQTATFTVVATGTAPLNYQWQKNNSPITGANSSTYTTPATTSNDNGAQFAVMVSNLAGSVTSNPATLTVNAAAALTITTTSLPTGAVQSAYSATLQAMGGTPPYTWSQPSGQLPPGLTLSSGGTLSGTPTTAGPFTATIQVQDAIANTASSSFTITINAAGTMPHFGHVFVIVGENATFAETYNSSNMPYLTSLANQYGLATKYWTDTHPSIGNYEVMTAGQIVTNTDSQTPSSLPLSADNIAFEVQRAGMTWKDYVETGNGCGALNSGTYYVRHDPLEYFTDVNTERANFVCFSQFATDLANHTLPNLSWLSQNGCDDAHDCSLGTFDNWLKTEIAPLLASSYFQPGGDGLLLITFDEDDKSGSPNCTTTTVGLGCGGQAETVVISPLSKLAYKSTAGDPANFNTTYDHANLLRTIADALGVNASGLGAAATRIPMADFF